VADFLVFLVACLAVLLLVSTLMYGAVRLAGWVFFGPRTKPYEPARQRVDRRGPRGPLRPPSKPPEWCARHARPRRDPDPDCLVATVTIPDRPDTAPLVRIDPDATAELSIPRDLVEENAA
jgi:hypothetical protein